MASEAKPTSPQNSDVTRRTWLAAERTWLAWWRTGIGASAVAIGVGRILPELTHGVRWPFRALGIAYGAIAVAVLVIGAVRQQRTNEALRRGSYSELSSPTVLYLTAAAVVVSLGSIIVIAIRL
jgi:putative membrane protein